MRISPKSILDFFGNSSGYHLILLFLLFFAFSNSIQAQTDTDGDTVEDSIDLDDDNDGIFDSVEGCETTDISGTIGIGSQVIDGSNYTLIGTDVTYDVFNPDGMNISGYDAGQNGHSIIMEADTGDSGNFMASYGTPISGVQFKLTDFDQRSEYTIEVYDDTNTLYDLSAEGVTFVGSRVTQTGNYFEADPGDTDGDLLSDDAFGAIYFYFPRAVSRIRFTFNHPVNSSTRFTQPVFCILDTDNDGIPDFHDLDSDNDGIHDVIESGGIDSNGNGTADDDDDNADNTTSNGIPTSAGGGNTPTDTGADGSPDYRNLDSDEDGCSDANEGYGSSNADGGDGGQYGSGTPAATGAFGLVTAASYDTGVVMTVTDASDATACIVIDTDGDGVLDDQEIADGTDPNDPCDYLLASITVEQTGDYMTSDCDGDGVQNWAEIRDGTNPEDPCDFIPASVTEEPSGDYLISDCDGDGVTNGTELTDGTDPADPCSFNASSITLDQTGAYLAADCDGDTIPNGQEITDGSNPNDPCSSRGGTPPEGITCDIIIDNDLVGPLVDEGFFRIGNIEAFPNNTVRIYNRWGILVYETTGYDNGSNNFRGLSDGRATISKDKALPAGVYFYIVEFMKNGENIAKSGYLYLNR